MVSSKVKIIEEKTLNYLASKLYDQMRSLKTRPAKHIVDYHSIYTSLYWAANSGCLYIFKVDGHLVGALAYTIETPWYSNFRCLDEMFVMCLDPNFHGFGRIALKFLKKKAMFHGCAILKTGAAMTDTPKIIENLYKRKGKCIFSYPNFVWVLPH